MSSSGACIARGGAATTSSPPTPRASARSGRASATRPHRRPNDLPRAWALVRGRSLAPRDHPRALRRRVRARAQGSTGDLDTDEDALRNMKVPDAFDATPPDARSPGDASPSSSSTSSSSSSRLAPSDEDVPFSLEFPTSLDDLGERWRLLPSRYRVILGTTCAFVLCNMDKVNISVAIIPMAKDMGWSVGTAGFLQSAFFYGFAASQLPGGYLATRFGGARMLPVGVFLWSAATCAVPFVADDVRALFFSRVLVGLGEGIAPSAATDVIARSVSATERSRAVAFVFNGFNVGSVLGLSLAPFIIETFGWRSVFVVFGGLGVAWTAWVGLGIYPRGGAMPGTRKGLVGERAAIEGLTGKRVVSSSETRRDDAGEPRGETSGTSDSDEKVPWGEIVRSTPLRALAYVHFCNNWGFYVLLAWLPSYFTQELGVNLTNASLFTLLPPLANIVVASFVGPLADSALERGVAPTIVRKAAQTVALCGPATFMAAACFTDEPVFTVAFLSVGLSLSSFSYAGLYCNHQDMSPRFASILLGITNTVGALPGVIGVPLTGYLLQRTDDWEFSMFLPAMILYYSGAAVFAKYGSAEKQPWG